MLLRRITSVFYIILFSFYVFASNPNNIPEKVQSVSEQIPRIFQLHSAWITILLSGLTLLATVIAVAFGTVVYMILRQLKELSKQQEISKDYIDKIETGRKEIERLKTETENMRNQIRDQELKQNLTEEEFAKFVSEVLTLEPSVDNINTVKNFIWTNFKIEEYNGALEKLKQVLNDRDLINMIRDKYKSVFGENISLATLITWSYNIKVRNIILEDLLNERILEVRKNISDKAEQTGRLYEMYINAKEHSKSARREAFAKVLKSIDKTKRQ